MPNATELLRRQKALGDFGDFVLDHDDLQMILDEGCRIIADALNADLAKVMEIERSRDTALVRAGVGWRDGIVGKERVSLSGQSSEAFAIEQGQPVITNNIATEKRFHFPAFLTDHGVIALVNVPIFLPGRIAWGVLQVDAREKRDFEEEDIQFLKTYSMVLGPVVDRLQKVANLRESQARQGLLQTSWETAADGTVVADSPSWREYTGQTLEEWLGYGWLHAVHPDDRAYAEQQWREAVAAQKLVNAEFRIRAADGSWRWTNVRAAPVLDPGGSIQKWVGMNIDIDDRKTAEQAVTDSEGRFRNLFETMGQGYVLAETVRDAQGKPVDMRLLEVNPAYERLMGISAEQARRRGAYEILPGVDRWWLETCDRIARAGRPEHVEHQYSGDGRWFEAWVYPRGADRYQVLFEDITERKRAEQLLRESQERQAFLLRFSDSLREEPDADAIALRAVEMLFTHMQLDRCYIGEWRLEEDKGDLPYQVGNHRVPPVPDTIRLSDFPEAMRIAVDRTLVINDVRKSELLSDADRHNMQGMGLTALVASAARKGDRVPIFTTVAVSADPREWTPTEIALIEEANERTWAAVEPSRAEHALRASEQRSRLLLAELQHRVRNILAVIRSVARRTGETTETVEDYVNHLEGRISAMARTQALLTRDAGAKVDLQNLLLDELETQAAQPEQYQIHGPDLELPPKAAEVLGLALHELATNSIKYGALSSDHGMLDVCWALIEGDGTPKLNLIWSETGIDISPDNHRQGFGTELITSRVPYELKGTGTMEFTADELIVRIEFPLTELASILQTDEGSRR